MGGGGQSALFFFKCSAFLAFTALPFFQSRMNPDIIIMTGIENDCISVHEVEIFLPTHQVIAKKMLKKSQILKLNVSVSF